MRAQLHLGEILSHNRMRVSTPPTVMIARPTNEFDADHKVVTERTRDQIRRLVEHLVDEVRRERLMAGLTSTGE
jgi:NAD(P)H-dependent FMN reductase